MPPEAVGGSIQTEIDRIAANVTAALAACTDKGASVPDGSTSDDLAAIIAAIEAGGGGMRIASGSITPSANTSALTVTHDLGATPEIVIVVDDTKSYNKTTNNQLFSAVSTLTNGYKAYYTSGTSAPTYNVYQYGLTSGYLTSKQYGPIYDGNETTFSIGTSSKATTVLVSGCTYTWYAIGG